MSKYDLAIIGAGWAGYSAALEAQKNNLKIVLIEQAQIGGTCLNRGCIPTKALLKSAKILSLARKSSKFGVLINNLSFDFIKMQERKSVLVAQLASGMQAALKNIDFVNGPARFISPECLEVSGRNFEAKNFLIATGAQPSQLPNLAFDGKRILSSDNMLELAEIPESLLIIGGGVIGCEFATLFSTLGSVVTVVEKMPQLLPGMDQEAAKKLQVSFKKRNISVNVGADAFTYLSKDFSKILLCVGRSANTQGLGLDKIGVSIDRSRIITDEYLKSSLPNIYAAGDCASKIMLAHYASYQGKLTVANMLNPGQLNSTKIHNVPGCIFTDPEIGMVGVSEECAKENNIKYSVHRFDFLASGMARILDETEGFIKIVTEQDTGRVMGGVIMGPSATELISILTLAVSNNLTVKQFKETIFPHPSLSESITEAF